MKQENAVSNGWLLSSFICPGLLTKSISATDGVLALRAAIVSLAPCGRVPLHVIRHSVSCCWDSLFCCLISGSCYVGSPPGSLDVAQPVGRKTFSVCNVLSPSCAVPSSKLLALLTVFLST